MYYFQSKVGDGAEESRGRTGKVSMVTKVKNILEGYTYVYMSVYTYF